MINATKASCTSVKSSDLAKYNRWDPAFFLALDEVRERYMDLKRTMPAEEALAILNAVADIDKISALKRPSQ